MTTRCKQCGTPSPTLGAERSLCERCASPLPRGRTNAGPADAESSGIIDVRAMLAILGDEGEARATSEAPAQAQAKARPRIPTPLPSALPLLPPPRPVAAASRSRIMSQKTGWRPLTALALGLAVALVGLTGYAVAKQPAAAPTNLIEVREVAAPIVRADAGADEADDAEAPDEAADASERVAAEATAEPEPAAEVAPRRRERTSRRTPRTTAGTPATSEAPSSAPAPASATPTATKRDEPKEPSVDCLLDKKKCAPAKAPAVKESAPRPAPSTLPAKLEASEITEGVRGAKAAAASKCSGLAKEGESVRIKISIAGATGSVISTKVEAGGARPELGACCARELAKASFPRVQKEQTGAVVTVRF